MDDVWIKTVRQLESDLANYRKLKRDAAFERDLDSREKERLDLASMKSSLNQRYGQLIGFTAGLADSNINFDCDLETPVLVVTSGEKNNYVFGPRAISSTEPFIADELRQFIEVSRGDDSNTNSQRPNNLARNISKNDEIADDQPGSAEIGTEAGFIDYFERRHSETIRLLERISDICGEGTSGSSEMNGKRSEKRIKADEDKSSHTLNLLFTRKNDADGNSPESNAEEADDTDSSGRDDDDQPPDYEFLR